MAKSSLTPDFTKLYKRGFFLFNLHSFACRVVMTVVALFLSLDICVVGNVGSYDVETDTITDVSDQISERLFHCHDVDIGSEECDPRRHDVLD
jgi:hypothetical protein